MTLALLAAVMLLGACASHEQPCLTTGTNPASQIWHSRITDADNERLRKWRDAWMNALANARSGGFGAMIDAEGALLDPDAALPLQEPTPGLYRCRTIKLGSQSPDGPRYISSPGYDCRISRENGTLRFAKLNGAQRPIGTLLPQTDRRMVLLGTLQLGDETNTLAYGRDQERDVAGMLEQIGDRRWRVVFPNPHFESLTDVIELVPKGTDSQ